MRNETDVDVLFAMADLALSENRLEEGKALLEDILFADPHYGRAYNHLGWFYAAKINDLNKAEELYSLAMRYSPDYPAVYINTARLYMQTRRFNDAKTLLLQALKVPGADFANIYDLLSGVYEHLCNFAEALKYNKKAMTEATHTGFIDYLKNERKRVKSKMSPFAIAMALF